jgi:hypothetical protein
MSQLTIETEDSFSSLLELAADNDVEGFKKLIEQDPSCIDEIGVWYVRKKGSKQIVHEHRTPLMVAAIYGSIDVLKLIISRSEIDVNLSCGPDKVTALHCAAAGGSTAAADVIKLLLAVGADPTVEDTSCHRPIDVIIVPLNQPHMKTTLEQLLANNISSDGGDQLPEQDSPVSPSISKFVNSNMNMNSNSISSEKKEYPIDPSLPDIKNSIYSTDEFRMFSFKVRPCSRAYSHDWTECPFVHPGENARRRDPRKYHYSCVPCPDFRKGACRRGDMCEYAHGVFECWLHPAQYRTRLCKDGTSCARRVCFFAHTTDELRPLFVSTGSAVPSPRSAGQPPGAMDMAAALSLFPGSPSSLLSPMSPSNGSQSPLSLSSWPQPNVPTLHLPGSNFQSSRLRSSFSARDIPPDDLTMLQELSCFSQSRQSYRSGGLTPSNLEDLFTAEISSLPQYNDPAVMMNTFQQQQSMLSPINTNHNHNHPLLQGNYGVSSPSRMSPRGVDPISPMSARLSALAQQQHHQLRSLSSRDLGSSFVGSPTNSNWGAKWGSPNRKVDWSINGDELGQLKRSSSFELKNNGEEPDLSWVQSLVKESPSDLTKENKSGPSVSGTTGENLKTNESVDHTVLGAWLEQMQLDQLVA